MGVFDFLRKKPSKEAVSRPDQGIEAYDDYLNQIGEYYVAFKELDLSEEDFKEARVTDLAEAWRLFIWFLKERVGMDQLTEEQLAIANQRIRRLAEVLTQKILELDHLYCLYHRNTDEPALFSQLTVLEDGRRSSSEPMIRIFTDRDLEVAASYPEDQFSIVKIDRADGQGILNFLHHAFYIDGAMGIELGSDAVSIASSKLLEEPDFSHLPEVQRPIHNPSIMRWLLLMAQLGDVREHPESQGDYAHYHYLMRQNLAEARFLVPSQVDGLSYDEEGNAVLSQGSSLALVTMDGRGKRKAIQMFTDWNQFRKRYDLDYDGWMMTIAEIIDHYDVTINPNPDFPYLGIYLDQEAFQELI
ncbi:SseB family protein [Streptococcus sp. DD13]|uniref:SseB family protein n=1 Tax=Streptococcus sp. DD13 TaxID=1777881 RepID=UPI00079CCAEA|nr:SseB family protein [Streptococcus sp. DD13]KXT79025.1 hypothetical protein STRDD13_00281 [Streptococcus sp. DD13]